MIQKISQVFFFGILAIASFMYILANYDFLYTNQNIYSAFCMYVLCIGFFSVSINAWYRILFVERKYRRNENRARTRFADMLANGEKAGYTCTYLCNSFHCADTSVFKIEHTAKKLKGIFCLHCFAELSHFSIPRIQNHQLLKAFVPHTACSIDVDRLNTDIKELDREIRELSKQRVVLCEERDQILSQYTSPYRDDHSHPVEKIRVQDVETEEDIAPDLKVLRHR